MNLSELQLNNLAKLIAMRKLEKTLTKNFHYFGGDDRMSLRLTEGISDKMIEMVDEIIERQEHEHPLGTSNSKEI